MSDPRYKNGVHKRQKKERLLLPSDFGWEYVFWQLKLKGMVYEKDGYSLMWAKPGTIIDDKCYSTGAYIVETPTEGSFIFTEATLEQVNNWVNERLQQTELTLQTA